MAYTSEQYKYLLFQRLRRHLAMETAVDRAYTQSFFGKLFDETITITEEAYNNFVKLMDNELQFCAQKNIYYASDISESMINEHGLLLEEAFAAIGITLEIEVVKGTSGSMTVTQGGDAKFTKPNGEVMVYSVRNGTNEFFVYSRACTEYNYAKLSAPYYEFADRRIPGLDEYNTRSAGPGTFWSYDAGTSTMTITGTGTYITAPQDPQLGGPYDVIIFGASVARITANSLKDNLRALVFWHAADAEILLEDGIAGTSLDVRTLEVYCDNINVRSYSGWPTSCIVNWHSLDEWTCVEDIPVSTLSYNGILLPEFRSTDPAAKPYIVIGSCTNGQYMAMTSASPKQLAEGKTTFSVGLFSACWYCTPGTYVWDYSASGYSRPAMTPIWANYDVLNADGTVFLKASEPTTL